MKTTKLLLAFFVLFYITELSAQTLRPADLVKEKKTAQSALRVSSMYDLVSDTKAERKAIGLENSAEFILNDNAMNSIMRTNNEFIEIQLPITDGRTVTLELVEVDIYQGNDHVYTLPKKERVHVNIGKHYRGIVKGDYESLVAMSFFDGQIDGFISEQEMPTVTVGKKKNSNYHVAYYDNQLPESFKSNCSVEDDGIQYTKEQLTNKIETRTTNPRCNRLYMEIDYPVYLGKGSDVQQTTNFVTGFMNQVITIYANEDILATLSPLNIWTESSPYVGNSSTEALAVLRQFQRQTTSIDGDLGHLVSTSFSYGGHAGGFDGVCNYSVNNKLAYSTIYSYYSDYPVSSYTVMVIAHEFGHLFGSRHTHACVWNGNSTAIDSCAGYVEGYCAEPGLPTGGGTMMSYCYNLPSVGTNFSKGFGEQPGNVIRNTNSSKSCNIRSCGDDSSGDEDTTPPTNPTNLVATNIQTTSVQLSWTASTDDTAVTGYEVYQDSSKVGTIDVTQSEITGLTPNTSYLFKVRAFDAAGNKSTYSNTITVKTQKEAVSCNETTALLVLKTDRYPRETSWELKDASGAVVAEGNPEEKLETYEESFCLADGCYTFIIKDSQGDGICCNYGEGFYSITVNGKEVAKGENFSSQDVKEFCIGEGDTIAPTRPTGLMKKSVTVNSISLAWSSSTDNVGVEGYIVYKDGVEIGKTTTTAYTVKELEENTTYVFYVKAYDKANNISTQSKSLSVKTDKKDVGGGDCNETNVVFELTTDKYGNETSWEIKNSSGIVVASGNRYGENQTYKINKCLPDDCYTFTIKDSYNDGICCKYGDGSYKLTVNGEVKASGAKFGASETTEFCSKDNPDPTNPVDPTDSNPVSYCELKGNNITYEWIKTVKINDTENQSEANGGYADFTNKVMNVNIGSNTISGTPGFKSNPYAENWYLWIDYNQDGIFSADELVITSRGEGTTEITTPFIVPDSAKLGSTRLRVAMKSTASDDACGSFTYGEVEDYTANIQSAVTTRSAVAEILTSIYPNPAPSNSIISMDVENVNTGTYKISDALGNVVASSDIKKNNQLNTSSLSSGIYLITIESEDRVITKRLVIQ